VSLGCRLGLAGGALVGSHQIGVWGEARQGEKVYHSLRSGEMKATLLANCPITEYLPEMPDTGVAIQLENLSSTAGEARDNFWTNYNSAVVTTVQGISNLPQTLSSIMSQALEAVQESTK